MFEHVCAHVCGGQRSTSDTLPSSRSPHSLRRCLSRTQSLLILPSGLAGELHPGKSSFLCSPALRSQTLATTLFCGFLWGCWDGLRSSHLHDKHFTNTAISPSPSLYPLRKRLGTRLTMDGFHRSLKLGYQGPSPDTTVAHPNLHPLPRGKPLCLQGSQEEMSP